MAGPAVSDDAHAVGTLERTAHDGVPVHLDNIAVREDRRGNGIGKELMRDMTYTASLNSLEGLTLEVRASNAPARGLYESFGFEVGGVRKRFYQNTEDAIIYWLNVGGNGDFKSQ